jgi:hypothetical protein
MFWWYNASIYSPDYFGVGGGLFNFPVQKFCKTLIQYIYGFVNDRVSISDYLALNGRMKERDRGLT